MGINPLKIGERIQESRKGRGLSQEQLAERINISVPHLSNIENGKTGFSLSVLVKLRDELDVAADLLLFGPSTGEDEIYCMATKELKELLKGCTKAQARAILDFIRSAKELLQQYGTGADGKS